MTTHPENLTLWWSIPPSHRHDTPWPYPDRERCAAAVRHDGQTYRRCFTQVKRDHLCGLHLPPE